MNTPNTLKYSKSHEWVKELDGGVVEIGLTDYAQDALGSLVFVNLPEEGDPVTRMLSPLKRSPTYTAPSPEKSWRSTRSFWTIPNTSMKIRTAHGSFVSETLPNTTSFWTPKDMRLFAPRRNKNEQLYPEYCRGTEGNAGRAGNDVRG